MALDKATLTAQFIQILGNPLTSSNVAVVATALANAIDDYVKTGNAIGTDTHGDGHTLTIV